MSAAPGPEPGPPASSAIERAANLLELEELARGVLPRMTFDYYAGGADGEVTLADNVAAFERRRIAYRVMAGVGETDPATLVLGERVSMPVLVAPTAFHRLAHPDGEAATARAAGEAGSLMILSTLSNTPVEEVVAACSGPVWFQLYVYRDRGASRALVERVEAAGCRALVVTVDNPRLGRRERDVRNRFHLPAGLAVANLTADGYGGLPPVAEGSGLAAYVGSMMDPNLTWDDLERFASWTRLPILLKGIVRADDAVRAADGGAAGIVVSNHGGRQLDGSIATLDALPPIADVLAARREPIELLLDGGVRRGTDVVKALALGARAVLIGRPVLWGLALAGADGVARVMAMLRAEIDLAMALAGARTVDEVTSDLIANPSR